MTERVVKRLSGRYFDSVKLLRVSEALQSLPGVTSAAAVMATEMNLGFLSDQGFAVGSAAPDDLMIAVAAVDETSIEAALSELEELLAPPAQTDDTTPRAQPRCIESALRRYPETNVVVIGVPGEHAALEAWAAIHAGRHVFLFSDNVPLEDEVRLKQAAAARGLLMMGPDCGTSILGHVGLGFANRVRPGSVGLVGASGTGIQQVASLVHMAGSGIAAAVGTGSRDLTAEVGGIMTLMAIDRLAADPDVERIGLISKPGDSAVTARVLGHLALTGKPAVACLLGSDIVRDDVTIAPTLTKAAMMLVNGNGANRINNLSLDDGDSERGAAVSAERGTAHPGTLLGLYCGGTLAQEAQGIVAQSALVESRIIDLGADEYTRGRAHPMIDPRLRAAMIATEGKMADVLLVDVVLGDLAHDDPAGAVVSALKNARDIRESNGRTLQVFAALIGTDIDPQGFAGQKSKLEAAGVCVSPSNELASHWAIDAALEVAS